MSSKLAPPPQVAMETMRALVSATTEFGAAKPWKIMMDCDVVGLIDSVTGETRIGTVLGNAGQVFGAVFYRRTAGLRWILAVLNNPESCTGVDVLEGMDCLKVEFVAKHDMLKEDLALLKTLNFIPSGRGHVWPQFQSSTPGWEPWFIDQTEAGQLLADLPRLTKFHALYQKHPDLFDEHPPAEIPFLPNPVPDRPLALEDLGWRPMLSMPETHEPFGATEEQLTRLRSLERAPKAGYEFACKIVPGSSVLENGRPCFSRISMLVERHRGLVLGFELSPAPEPLAQSAGQGLVNALVQNGFLPGTIFIDDLRLEQIFKPLCDALEIKLSLLDHLDVLPEALDSLNNYMLTGQP